MLLVFSSTLHPYHSSYIHCSLISFNKSYWSPLWVWQWEHNLSKRDSGFRCQGDSFRFVVEDKWGDDTCNVKRGDGKEHATLQELAGGLPLFWWGPNVRMERAAGELFCRRVCELDSRWIEHGMIAELKRIILREASLLDQTSSRWIQHCNSLLPEPSTVHRVSGEQGSVATVFPCMVSVWSPFQTEVSRSYFRHSRRLFTTHVNMLHIYYDVHKLKKC